MILRILVVVVVSLLVCSATHAQLQRPIPTPGESSNKPENQPTSEQNIPNKTSESAQIPPTRSPPSVAPPNQEVAKQDTDNQNCKSSGERWLIIMNGLLIIAVFYQALLMRKGLGTTKLAAEAAKEGANLQRIAMINTQRPFLFIKEIKTTANLDFITKVPMTFVITPTILNCGNTPAMDTRIWFNHLIVDKNTPDEQIVIDVPSPTQKGQGKIFIGPGISYDLELIKIDLDSARSIYNETHRLLWRIAIEYKGVFAGSVLHHTNVCFESTVVLPPWDSVREGVPEYFSHRPFGEEYNYAD